MSLNHFLLIYSVKDQKLLDYQEFGEDAQLATDSYSEVEREYRSQPHIEIVLVGADSIETIRKTHSHYFADDDLVPFARLLAEA